ncbi:DUF4118 domain-containing protein [Novosphingobium sp. FSY-8]|uniref:histidine kinase n=1 Tax=Novosphingobium ovatum TaxID=1908523 RepID=A0ABW9XHK3_9SPHN|nr:ATP-binding protein [Novosphingobium ovatum]NBC38034.1 DUF4118 domain-containing protein [Novosphingobium ovatum]
MTRTPALMIEALLAVAAVAWLTATLLPVLGLASCALLFLLPVLLAATRGGVWPGLSAALAGAAAYNFFLLEPRYSFRVHELDNLISVIVLGLVAVVTSRLATRLMRREAEANERAHASEEAATLANLLAGGPPDEALGRGLGFVGARYGDVRLLDESDLTRGDAAFPSLDLSAAAWAIHNGDITGHGTETMTPAEWTFVPLAARSRADNAVAAFARPADGRIRTPAELGQMRQLCLLLGQCRDRACLEAERREREMVDARDRLRRTLLASLAHDFRTPLTVIGGRLELLAAHNPEAHDALLAARRLDRTMTDLIGLARIEDGSLHACRDSLDVVDVLAAVCEGWPMPAGIALHRAIAPDLPFVMADPVLLHHVMTNLIDNALRHAKTCVTVSAAQREGRLWLMVDDDGPGVPPADRQRIFERFRQIKGSDRKAGSGLGLAIVKGFAEAMDITVWIEAAPHGGARFVLSLPVCGAPEDGEPA